MSDFSTVIPRNGRTLRRPFLNEGVHLVRLCARHLAGLAMWKLGPQKEIVQWLGGEGHIRNISGHFGCRRPSGIRFRHTTYSARHLLSTIAPSASDGPKCWHLSRRTTGGGSFPSLRCRLRCSPHCPYRHTSVSEVLLTSEISCFLTPRRQQNELGNLGWTALFPGREPQCRLQSVCCTVVSKRDV
jgi:hypothetical protein